ncbi:hypothetical protein OAO01_09515 [Oligoflexia bacterium]|nr:hypothetical protein [Oligoflexia bacterium]
MTRIQAIFFIAILALILPRNGFPATDGSLGVTSTGSTDLSITVPIQVKISHVANLTLPSWTGAPGSIATSDDLCIYTNDSAAVYRVTATGDGSGGAFEVSDLLTNTMSYKIRWNDQTGTTGNVELTSGSQSAQQSGANTTAQDCSGGDNANVEILIENSELTLTPSGTFTGTLTLLVEPG